MTYAQVVKREEKKKSMKNFFNALFVNKSVHFFTKISIPLSVLKIPKDKLRMRKKQNYLKKKIMMSIMNISNNILEEKFINAMSVS